MRLIFRSNLDALNYSLLKVPKLISFAIRMAPTLKSASPEFWQHFAAIEANGRKKPRNFA